MITGIHYLRIFSVMNTHWEKNFTDLQANDFGNLGKNNSGNILVGNHALALFRSLCNKRQLSRKKKFDKFSGMFPALVFVAFRAQNFA